MCVLPCVFCSSLIISSVRGVECLNGNPLKESQVLQEMVMMAQRLASSLLNLGWVVSWLNAGRRCAAASNEVEKLFLIAIYNQ